MPIGQRRIGCIFGACQQLVFVPELEHHTGLVLVELRRFVQLLFIKLLQRLQAQQRGGLRQVGVQQVAHLVLGLVPGEGSGTGPGQQHQCEHGQQQPRLQ